jgi:hypothetical protein
LARIWTGNWPASSSIVVSISECMTYGRGRSNAPDTHSIFCIPRPRGLAAYSVSWMPLAAYKVSLTTLPEHWTSKAMCFCSIARR